MSVFSWTAANVKLKYSTRGTFWWRFFTKRLPTGKNEKSRLLTCPGHKIYRVEAVGLKVPITLLKIQFL